MTNITLFDKWKLLQAIMQDDQLCPAAKIVAVRLLDHLNNRTGQCNPSYATLANGTGLTRRRVIDGVGQLEKRGWLSINRTNGGAHGRGPETNGFQMNFERLRPGENISLPPVQNLHPPSEKSSTPSGENISPKHKKNEHGKEHRTSDDVDRQFEQFYAAYPKRVERQEALRAYRRVIEANHASHEQLLEGAKRYHAVCAQARTEQRYIKNPVTWLRKGCWTDEYFSHSPSSGAGGAAAGTPADTARWEGRLAAYRQSGEWPSGFGPAPGLAGCRVPPEVLTKYGYAIEEAA